MPQADGGSLKSAQGNRNPRVWAIVDTGIPTGTRKYHGEPKTLRHQMKSPPSLKEVMPALEEFVGDLNDKLIRLKARRIGLDLPRRRAAYHNATVALRKAVNQLR